MANLQKTDIGPTIQPKMALLRLIRLPREIVHRPETSRKSQFAQKCEAELPYAFEIVERQHPQPLTSRN
jgi:hypothetical protein